MSELLENGFKLGDALVKPTESVIVLGGRPRHVEPKAMQVLVALAKAGEAVVPRERLTTEVWPRGYVTDDALNRCISHLRSALDDNPRDPLYIATVPRKGYRLALPVALLDANTGHDSTLVLPFQNLTSSQEGYFADGLTELLIARLSVTLEQPVISRTTAMTFKNAQRDLPSISKQLGVRWVVEGSVMSLGEQVQVVVQLIDAHSDSHSWADTWTRPLENTLTLLNEISREIAVRIRTEMQPGPARMPRAQSLPSDLLRQYLLGLQLTSRRSPPALRQAMACFEKVLQELPDHAPSLSGVGMCWVLLAHYGAVPVQEGFSKARQFAQKALALDSEPQADALLHLAAVEFFFDWDFDGAEASVERGLAIDPHHNIGLLMAANINLVKRRNERAQGFMDRALAQDPLNIGLLMNSGDHLILQQRFGEAVNALNAALEIDPGFRPALLRLALANSFDGRAAEALECLDRARSNGGEDAAYFEYLAIVNGRLGQEDAARAAATKLQALFDQSAGASPWSLARAWTSAGDLERGVACLESALEARSSSMPFLAITPVLAPIRDLPRVREIMRKAGLPG